MYYNEKHGLMYLASPATGSNAVREAIRLRRGFIQLSGHHTRLDPKFLVHEDIIFFHSIRNHYDAVVSWYYKTARGYAERPFGLEFLARMVLGQPDIFPAPGIMWYHIPYYLIDGKRFRVIRKENLESDLNEILVERGVEPVELLPVNYSKARQQHAVGHWSKYHTQETRQYIDWVWGKEIKAYGYEFAEEDNDG